MVCDLHLGETLDYLVKDAGFQGFAHDSHLLVGYHFDIAFEALLGFCVVAQVLAQVYTPLEDF